MSIIKKVFITSLALCASSLALAMPDSDTRLKELERKVDKIYTKTASGTEGAKTASARPDVEGNGYFLFFDIFYWQGKTNSSPYALTSANASNSPVQLLGQQSRADLNWDWGFKAGLGINFDHDGWDVLARYTYFSTSSFDTTSVEPPSVIFPQIGDGTLGSPSVSLDQGVGYCLKATSDISLDYDNVDLDIGRNYFVSHNLSFRPSVGLQATWLKTQQKVNYTGGNNLVFSEDYTIYGAGINSLYVRERSRYWGMGPRLALDSKWYLTNGFSIFGNGSASLLYGLFHNFTRNWYSANDNKVYLKDNFHRFVPNANISLGLSYDTYVCNDKQHVGVSLGYETQYYWRANQTIQIAAEDNTMYGVMSEDISFRGVTLEVRWDF